MFRDGTHIEVFRAAIQAVCDRFDVTKEELRGQSRVLNIVGPRQIAMSLIFDAGSGRISKSEIGRYFGGRDHTTVLNNLGRVKVYREDASFQEMYEKLLRNVDAISQPVPFIRNKDVVFKSRRAG